MASFLMFARRSWYAPIMVVNTGAAILERLINPDNDDLSVDAARSILRLDFSPPDHERVDQSSAKASAGTLTDDERTELNEYIRVADLLAVQQSKARQSLKHKGESP